MHCTNSFNHVEAQTFNFTDQPPTSTPPPQGFYKEQLVTQATLWLCAKNPSESPLASIGTAVGSSKSAELLGFYAAQMKPLKNISIEASVSGRIRPAERRHVEEEAAVRRGAGGGQENGPALRFLD